MEQLAKIYKMTNLINEQIYIGQTTLTMEERIERHLKSMRDEQDERPLYKDMRQYGMGNFKVEIIDECFERHKFIVEEYWYHHYLDKGYPMYDIKQGAKHSKNTKQRMTAIRNQSKFDYSSPQFKNKMSEKTAGDKNGMFGKKGDNAINGRIVVAYNEEGQIAHEFVSVKEALNFLNIKGHVALNDACRTNKKYRGYYWKKEWIDR